MSFVETSAQKSENIDKVFDLLSQDVYENIKTGNVIPNVEVGSGIVASFECLIYICEGPSETASLACDILYLPGKTRTHISVVSFMYQSWLITVVCYLGKWHQIGPIWRQGIKLYSTKEVMQLLRNVSIKSYSVTSCQMISDNLRHLRIDDYLNFQCRTLLCQFFFFLYSFIIYYTSSNCSCMSSQ